MPRQRVAEEAQQAVHDDGPIGRGLERGVRDHLLELGPPVIGGRGARLDVFLGDGIAVALRSVPHLAQLVGDG